LNANLPLLERVAEATALREGATGVAQVLRVVYLENRVTLKALSRRSGLPIPVLAAVRGELEKARILERRGGLVLTERGRRFVETHLKITTKHDPACPVCHGRRIVIAEDLRVCVQRLERILRHSPAIDVTLDQSPCLAETSVRRALCMYQHGALEGRHVVILGDDDLVSLSVGFLGQALGSRLPARLTVVETDQRWIDLIQDVSAAEDLGIEVVRHDLRDPLPRALQRRFDTFETDPPYTGAGMALFVSRAIQALKPGDGQQGFLSFGHRSPSELLAVHRKLAEMGLAIHELIPTFNAYRGASILGGSSQLICLLTTTATKPLVPGLRFEGPIYTGEFSPTRRLYRCTHCKAGYEVGQGRPFGTIEALKAAGCGQCGNARFRYVRRVAGPGDGRRGR
jgi:predicted methyltransferase/DNA-directed RNA polymerase subunit RPC12/RpoP